MFFRVKLYCANGQVINCALNSLNPYSSLIDYVWEELDETNTRIAWVSKVVSVKPQLLLS